MATSAFAPQLRLALNGLAGAVCARKIMPTRRHLPILGELGELFAEIMFALKRHGPMTQGSDGKLGENFVEVKTVTPDKTNDRVRIKRAGDGDETARHENVPRCAAEGAL